jgi:hypothetical protein
MLELWLNVCKLWQNSAKLCLNYSETVPKSVKKMGNFFRVASCVSRIALEEFLGAGCPAYFLFFSVAKDGFYALYNEDSNSLTKGFLRCQ